MPIFRIRPSVARAMLEPDGMVLTADGQSILLGQSARTEQSGPGWFTVDMSAIVRMSLTLGAPQDLEIPCVMGFQPGSDFELATELVVLFASYDGLGTDPDGTVFPAVNHNASGVGMLLEIARVWQEQDLDVRRSVLFVAWGGSQLDNSGAEALFKNSGNFSFLLPSSQYPRFDPLLVFQPDYIGAGGEKLFIHPASHRQLSGLVEETAQELGIPVVYDLDDEWSEAVEAEAVISGLNTPWVYFTWADAQVAPDEDQLQRVEAEKLQKMGEAFALALTRIVREAEY
jgi:hypothetical protein